MIPRGGMEVYCGRIRALTLGLLLTLGPFLAACADADRADPVAFEEHDSAGVRIVTHAPAAPPDTVPMAPALSIGREGDPDYELFRVVQISPLASGNVVVANSGTTELFFYGADGRFLRRVGGRGDGPREFGFLTTVYTRPGDTLMVMDPRRRRLVVFDSAGVFQRDESFADDFPDDRAGSFCSVPALRGLLSDGAHVTQGWNCMQFEGSPGVRPSVTTLYVKRDERTDTIAGVMSNRVWEWADPDDPRNFFSLIPFQSFALSAVGRDRVYLSRGATPEIEVYDPRGRLTARVREDEPARPVTGADRSAYREDWEAARDRPFPRDVPFAEAFGAYDRLIVAYGGDLWARWASRPGATSVRWSVFSPDGTRRRHFVLPDVEVEAIRDGRIWAHVANDVGVQTVVALEVPGADG